MKNLHKIPQQGYSDYQLSILWWLTVENIWKGYKARINADGSVDRVSQIIGEPDEVWDYPKYQTLDITERWIEVNRPGYDTKLVIKGHE